MRDAVFHEYLTGLLNGTEKCLFRLRLEQQPEAFHSLRVNLKKIKAVLSFAEKTCEYSSNIHLLDTLFKLSGKIRETQLGILQVENGEEDIKSILHDLKSREQQLIIQFRDNIPVYQHNLHLFRATIKYSSEEFSKKKIPRFFNKKLERIHKLASDPGRKKLHLLRKNLKSLLYTWQSLPSSLRKNIELDKKKLEKWQEKIGEWHDQYALLLFLREIEPELASKSNSFRKEEKKSFRKISGSVHKLKSI